MKMTRLEWRYLQKIALDHPYFDTHELPLTEKEADAIVKANIRMTGKEFVDSIYAQLGMTRPSEVKKPFAWLRSIGEQFTIPPIRKIVITALAILLLIVFFAATPMGQAIAESVIQYIVTLFDDGRLVINRNDNELVSALIGSEELTDDGEQDESDDTTTYIFLNSFGDFTKATGKTPFVLPIPCIELYYEYDESIDYLTLYVWYETSKGRIDVLQIWNSEDLITSTSTGFTIYDADNTISYSIEKDGIIICKVFQDSIISLSAKGTYALEELIDMME